MATRPGCPWGARSAARTQRSGVASISLLRATRYLPVPPVLTVEVAGEDDDEDESALRAKARWYFDHGVLVVWLVLPRTREVVVLSPDGSDRRYRSGERLEESPALPGLSSAVDELSTDLDRRGS